MKGVRNVVGEAHAFVRSYADATGGIPADMLARMGHMLAHCGMTNLMHFLRAHGFDSPGHFLHFAEMAAAAGVTPDSTRSEWSRARALALLPKHLRDQ